MRFHSKPKPLVALAVLTIAHAAAWSQALPLVPSRVVIEPQRAPANNEAWNIGPVFLTLRGWSPGSGAGATLKAPDGTIASFVLAEATKAASDSGYSAVQDSLRGPAAFSHFVQRDVCTDPNSLSIGSLKAPAKAEARVAKCSAEVKTGVLGIYAQIALYSPRHILQVHVVGSEETVSSFLEAFQAAKWKNEI